MKRRRLLLSPMGLRVLVVDAIQINQKMMARRLAGGELKELKWKVEFANTGEEAMQRLEGAGGGFDVIVMNENTQSAGGVLTDTTKLIRRGGGEDDYCRPQRELHGRGQGGDAAERTGFVLGKTCPQE